MSAADVSSILVTCSDQPKTIGSLVELFGEKSFAVLFLLLLAKDVPALAKDDLRRWATSELDPNGLLQVHFQ